MTSSRVHVPQELTNLLLEFTVNVLVERPNDLVAFAANYFSGLRDNRERNRGQVAGDTQHPPGENAGASTAKPTENALPTDDVIPDDEAPMPEPSKERRKSVFAEQYNPEEDTDQDEEKVVYPKTDEQRQTLTEAVKNILLFRELDEKQMKEVLDAMFERKVLPDELIIRQGDDGDYFYVIESGIYNVYLAADGEEKLVGKYENSGSFGELALMYNMPRAATVQSITEGSIWAMNRQTFRRIVLKSAFKKRQEYEHLLEGVPMLKSLEKYERLNLCDALMPKTYEDGAMIIHQGDEADGMYFVVEGIVRIMMVKEGDSPQSEVEMTRLKQGDYFGELALVTHKPRAASVYAVGTVKLAFLDVQAFERLLGPCMDILRRNIDDYEKQVAEIFGSDVSDLR